MRGRGRRLCAGIVDITDRIRLLSHCPSQGYVGTLTNQDLVDILASPRHIHQGDTRRLELRPLRKCAAAATTATHGCVGRREAEEGRVVLSNIEVGFE